MVSAGGYEKHYNKHIVPGVEMHREMSPKPLVIPDDDHVGR